jgi:hypothetical protein
MKQLFTKLAVFFFLLFAASLVAQIRKPILMAVPSEAWCVQNGYIVEINNNGNKVRVADYKRAIKANTNLKSAISIIEQLMRERDILLINFGENVNSYEQEAANNTADSNYKAENIISSLNELLKITTPNILLELNWKVNKKGPQVSLTYNIQAFDPYTNKIVASASGTGPMVTTADFSVLFQEAASQNIDNFIVQLQDYFKDIEKNGQEVVIYIATSDTWVGNLKAMYEGEELSGVIERWISRNANNGRFSMLKSTDTIMLFNVRIPILGSDGRSLTIHNFASSLRKFLKNSPYNLKCVTKIKGPGQATIILGDD